MRVLEGLSPQNVFYFFEEISRIPHGSGNVKQISNYLKKFADDRGLACVQDDLMNIIIVKEATEGYEEEEPYILQGHMDMVAVSKPGYDIDMTKDSLRLRVEDGRIRAEGTSLGGDDGIAIAYALALLDADDISHPRLEVILTVNEETGMEGALGIDLSMLRGKRLINLDQEEEGVVITSCAGGARVDVNIPLEEERVPDQGAVLYRIKAAGLLGGHSGIEIDKGRGNANRLLGRILLGLSERFDVRLCRMTGGMADNAIPREAEAVILLKTGQAGEAADYVRQEEKASCTALGDKAPDVILEFNPWNYAEQNGTSPPKVICRFHSVDQEETASTE